MKNYGQIQFHGKGKHGDAIYDGKDKDGKLFSRYVWLTQEPYLSGTHENPYYEAHAVDSDGNDYQVIWDLITHVDDPDDDCDWDAYSVYKCKNRAVCEI